MREGYKISQPAKVDHETTVVTVSNYNQSNEVLILTWVEFDMHKEEMLKEYLVAIFKVKPRIPIPKP